MPSAPSVIGQHFAFAHGRTGVLQLSLLSQSDIDRLLGAHDQRETEQVLIELKFTKLIDQSLRDPDAILRACQEWVRREVSSMTPDDLQPVFNILWLENDQPVLAYLLKRHKGLSSEISHVPSTAYSAFPVESLRQLVEEDTENNLPADLVAFVRRIKEEKMTDPRLIDAAVAQYVADVKIALVKKSGSSSIKQYVQHGIDAQNIRTALRFSEEQRASAVAHLITGGTIKPEQLMGRTSNLAAQVRLSGFHELATIIDKNPDDSNGIERALNDILAEDISVMWNVILSVEPLFAFASTALAHIRLIRAIMIGKRNALSPQHIKQMIPPFLPASHYVL